VRFGRLPGRDLRYARAGGKIGFGSNDGRPAGHHPRSNTHHSATRDSPIACRRKNKEGSGGNHEYLGADGGVPQVRNHEKARREDYGGSDPLCRPYQARVDAAIRSALGPPPPNLGSNILEESRRQFKQPALSPYQHISTAMR
jgi:hypothetical protein